MWRSRDRSSAGGETMAVYWVRLDSSSEVRWRVSSRSAVPSKNLAMVSSWARASSPTPERAST